MSILQESIIEAAKQKVKGAWDYVKKNPGKVALGAAGLAAAAYGANKYLEHGSTQTQPTTTTQHTGTQTQPTTTTQHTGTNEPTMQDAQKFDPSKYSTPAAASAKLHSLNDTISKLMHSNNPEDHEKLQAARMEWGKLHKYANTHFHDTNFLSNAVNTVKGLF